MDKEDAETIYEALVEVLGKEKDSLDMLDILKDEIMSTAELNNSQKKTILSIVENYNGNHEDIGEIITLLNNSPSFVGFMVNEAKDKQ